MIIRQSMIKTTGMKCIRLIVYDTLLWKIVCKHNIVQKFTMKCNKVKCKYYMSSKDSFEQNVYVENIKNNE